MVSTSKGLADSDKEVIVPLPQAEPCPPAVSQIKPVVTQGTAETHTKGDDSEFAPPQSKKNAKNT